MTHHDIYRRVVAFLPGNRSRLARVLAAGGIVSAAGVFALFGPPRAIEVTESPSFCALCHSEQHRDWLHSAHRGEKCVDCHLPNNNPANHYMWKSIDGAKDVFFQCTGLGDGNDTELSRHGKKVLQANCIRCHYGMVSRIDNERSCTDCHRAFTHKLTALTLTREENKR